MDPTIYTVSTWVIPVVLAVTLHEAAHAWMAERFGDDTARKLGRVTFNPFKHIDPVGTVLLPAILLAAHSPMMFGYAKPVPVNMHRLTPRYLGMFSVALSGPGTNILLAIVSALWIAGTAQAGALGWWNANMFHSVIINVMLAVFNLLPILPLDGGRMLRAVLPGKLGTLYAQSERFGTIIILLILIYPSLVMHWVGSIAGFFITFLLTLTGHSIS
jgi:Zn-dependent protease